MRKLVLALVAALAARRRAGRAGAATKLTITRRRLRPRHRHEPVRRVRLLAARLKTYDASCGHYYTGTTLGALDANPEVRVLLQGSRKSISLHRRRSTPATRSSTRPQTYTRAPQRRRPRTCATRPARAWARSPGPLRVDAPVGQAAAAERHLGARRARRPATAASLLISAVGLAASTPSTRSTSRTTSAAWSAPRARRRGRPRRSRPRPSPRARTRSPPTPAAPLFDQYADTRSQVYRGVAAETPNTDAAVAATTGQVVTYGGQPVDHLLLLDLGRRDRERRELVRRLAAQAVAEGRRRPVRQRLAQAPLGPVPLHRRPGPAQAAPLPAGALQAHQGPPARRLAARRARAGGRHRRRRRTSPGRSCARPSGSSTPGPSSPR